MDSFKLILICEICVICVRYFFICVICEICVRLFSHLCDILLNL
jgi:hypothetical protein